MNMGRICAVQAVLRFHCQKLPLEQGSMMIVEPHVCAGILRIAKRTDMRRSSAMRQAGALGRMILRLGQHYQVPVIHIVRRAEQVELLRSLGAEFVLNSSHAEFHAELCARSSRLKATLILDPVGGEATRQLLDCAPQGSTALVYGSLSGTRRPRTSEPDQNHIAGFFLPDWMATRGLLRMLLDVTRARRLAPKLLQVAIQKRLPLPAVQQAIDLYRANPMARSCW
jgi:NADPH:quinone reductase-like Zn-dependent oxidoreductase